MDLLHFVVIVFVVVVTTGHSSAIPQSDEHKSRVVDRVSMRAYFDLQHECCPFR